MSVARSNASWERVLAAMEAEAARAAALLTADDAHASAGIEYDGYDAPPSFVSNPVEVPATWRLPSSSPAGRALPEFMTTPPADLLPAQGAGAADRIGAELPDPADLPPLTPELQQRLEQLHATIISLRSDLAEAMAEAEVILSRPGRRPAPAAPRPELVDRRV